MDDNALVLEAILSGVAVWRASFSSPCNKGELVIDRIPFAVELKDGLPQLDGHLRAALVSGLVCSKEIENGD